MIQTKLKYFLLATLLLMTSIGATFCHSQVDNERAICGIEKRLEKIYNDPVLLEEYEENKNPITRQNVLALSRLDCTSANTIQVPLAFHFDDAFSCADAFCILTEIEDVIATLNKNFSDNRDSENAANCLDAYTQVSRGACINFYLARPPVCSELDTLTDAAITIGVFHGSWSAGGNGAGGCWDDYLNIFVQNDNGFLGQIGYLGISDQIPGYLEPEGPGEGITMIASSFGGADTPCGEFDTDTTYGEGATLAHEIGHYLGLPHIWGDVNGGGCDGDDGFEDTPNQAREYWGCPDGCVESGCGENQQTANFMNYSDGACKDMFTVEQAEALNYCAIQFFAHLNILEANLNDPIICRGCTDPCAPNFDSNAFFEDDTCLDYNTICDDENCNTNDSYDYLNCTCVNIFIPEHNCDDGDCNTVDNYDYSNCICVNTPIPEPNCNDYDCNTDDSYDYLNCTCVNTFIPEPDCDDNNCNTEDIYNRESCSCSNIPLPQLTCDQEYCTNGGTYVYDYDTCMCLLDQSTALGCTDESACNFNPLANCDDNSCNHGISSCIDPCEPILGCMHQISINYNPDACIEDGSCRYPNQPIFAPSPAESTLTVTIDDDMLGAEIVITNTSGELMPVIINGSTNYNSFTLDISSYEPGIYYFTAIKDDQMISGSFIKA